MGNSNLRPSLVDMGSPLTERCDVATAKFSPSPETRIGHVGVLQGGGVGGTSCNDYVTFPQLPRAGTACMKVWSAFFYRIEKSLQWQLHSTFFHRCNINGIPEML